MIHRQWHSAYKYLGVQLQEEGKARWTARRRKLMCKASESFWRAWGLGMEGGWLSARAAAGLWTTLVRCVLEYGAEVDSGRWEEAEVMQRLAGRMCLGVGREVPNEVVRGELGWWEGCAGAGGVHCEGGVWGGEEKDGERCG